MTNEQKLFWEEISEIQNEVVQISLSELSKYNDDETLLIDVTFETIYRVMELIDGVRNKSIRGEIISSDSGCAINSGIRLHDCCEEFLKGSRILKL